MYSESRRGRVAAAYGSSKSKIIKEARRRGLISKTTGGYYDDTFVGSYNPYYTSNKNEPEPNKEINGTIKNYEDFGGSGNNGEGGFYQSWPIVDENGEMITTQDTDTGEYYFFGTDEKVIFKDNDVNKDIIDKKGNILYRAPKDGVNNQGTDDEYNLELK